jgi:hypothetical protein
MIGWKGAEYLATLCGNPLTPSGVLLRALIINPVYSASDTFPRYIRTRGESRY